MTDVVVCTSRRSRPVGMVCYVPTPDRPLRVEPGERLYIVHSGDLWGWCTVAEVLPLDRGVQLVLRDVQRCWLKYGVRNFAGYRYRWWDRSAERYPADDAHHQADTG